MGGIFSSGRKDQFGEALIVSQKLRNAAWMLSSIPDLRTAFIQYLKDKRWVALYLERIHCGCAEMDDSVSMAVRYNFPAELLELFPPAEPSHDNVSVADTALPSFLVDSINSHQQDATHQSPGNKTSLPATGASPVSKEAASENGTTTSPTLHRDASIHPTLVSLQSTMFVSTSSLLANSAQCNMTNIQSSIQQDLKLVVIAGILLIYVDSTEYKQWIRNHMSLVTFTEICQQELEQSLRSLRNFRPPSLSLTGNNNHRSVRRKVHPQNRSNSPSNRKNALRKELAKRAKQKQEALEQQVDAPADTNPASSSSVASESPEKLRIQQQQQLRNRRRQEHNERLKKVIFAALSIPFAGGHTLRHVLSTSDWLTQLVHFIHYLPVGVNVASTSALLYHSQMAHRHPHLTGCCGMCCTPPREDCPVLYVNRHQEIMTEMPEDAMLGHSIGHMLANHYLVHVATHCHQPRSSSSEHNVVSTHTTTSKTVSSEVPSLRIDDPAVHVKPSGSVGRRPTVAGSPFSHIIDDVGSIPLSDDEKQLLRRIKDLEMQVLKRQQAAHLTYRIPHYDGYMYWHFVKCLPVYHKLCDLVDDEYIYPLQSESSKERLEAQRGSAKAEENPRPKDPSPRHRYGVNELASFEDDFYENAWDLTQRTVDGGLLHVVTSHTVLRDVMSAHPPRVDSAVLSQVSDGKSVEPLDSSLLSPKAQLGPPRESSAGSLPPVSVTHSHSDGQGHHHPLGTALAIDRGDERLYTHSDMQNLAMDLQAVDDLLLILSVLF